MEVINNIDKRLGDDLRMAFCRDAKVSIAASYFSIYAYEALKSELERVKELRFIFTSPAFIADQFPKEKRESYIPKLDREKSLYGTELEIRLKNELSQKAIAREWPTGSERKPNIARTSPAEPCKDSSAFRLMWSWLPICRAMVSPRSIWVMSRAML